MNIKIGFGKENINPKIGVELSGYGYFLKRRNIGVIEDLYARAFVIEVNGEKTILFNADLIGLTPELSVTLENLIESKYGIPYDNIMIACIHTHNGPNTGNLNGCGEFDKEYYQSLMDKFMASVDAAMADLGNVTKVSTNTSPIENSFAYDRTTPGGPIDTEVRTIYFEREGSRPFALVNYSCHPTSYGPSPEASSEYCGILCRYLDEEGIDAIYLNGFCGNSDPREREDDPKNCAAKAAKQLRDIVLPMFTSGNPIEINDVVACGDYLPMELLPMSLDDIENAYDYDFPDKVAFERVRGSWTWIAKHRVIHGDCEFDYMQYKALRLGKLLFIYVSGEVVIQFYNFLKEAFPDYLVICVGNAFSTTRYIGTEAHVSNPDRRYEGFSSSFTYNAMPIAHFAGEHFFENMAEQVKEIL